MTEVLPVDAQLDLEFAFTSWRESCRDLLPTLQQCRRRAGHDGDHAAGYGEQRRRWTDRRQPQCGDRDYVRCPECQVHRTERHLPGCDAR